MRFACLLAIACSLLASVAWANPGEVSFTPTGLRFPIMKISIGRDAGSVGTATDITDEQVLYRREAATEAECLVGLTDQAELDRVSAAAQNVEVATGTYDVLTLSSCAEGRSGLERVSIWLKGQFAAGGTTYSTSATAAGGVVTDGEPEFTRRPAT